MYFLGEITVLGGNNSFTTDIYIKEFASGKVIKEGVHLNTSKMLVILNYVDYMKEPIQRINNGEPFIL